MCDYSIEIYGSRPAQEGERYETHRFPSGAVGFVSPGDKSKAICFQCDTRVRLIDIPQEMQEKLGIGSEIAVVFAQRDVPPGLSPTFYYRDGVRLEDGRFVLLQDFPAGVGAYVEELLENAKIGERESVVVR